MSAQPINSARQGCASHSQISYKSPTSRSRPPAVIHAAAKSNSSLGPTLNNGLRHKRSALGSGKQHCPRETFTISDPDRPFCHPGAVMASVPPRPADDAANDCIPASESGGEAPGTLGDVTNSSRMPGYGRLRRGMVRGMAHRTIPAQRVPSVRLGVLSVQVERAERGAVLLIIRRAWVRAPPAHRPKAPSCPCAATRGRGCPAGGRSRRYGRQPDPRRT